MKTIIKSANLANALRVSDEKAADYVKNMQYRYIPKNVWKTYVRDALAKIKMDKNIKKQYADMALAETLVEKKT